MDAKEIKETMIVEQCAVGGFDDNFSYVVIDRATKIAAIIDPAGELSVIDRALKGRDAQLKVILITHSHFDHIEGIDYFLQKDSSIEVYVHKNAKAKLPLSEKWQHFVGEGSMIAIGQTQIDVLHTPGHIDDAVCYYEKTYEGVGALFTGDTLFVEGCGRTDQRGVKDLWESLQKIATLPSGTQIYPGHDYGSRPHSTVSWEKEHNPYILCKNFEEFEKKRL